MQSLINITSTSCTERDVRLNEAIDAAMSVAARNRAGGILVTRHAPTRFTVSVTQDVPYGTVKEQDEMATPTSHPAS